MSESKARERRDERLTAERERKIAEEGMFIAFLAAIVSSSSDNPVALAAQLLDDARIAARKRIEAEESDV